LKVRELSNNFKQFQTFLKTGNPGCQPSLLSQLKKTGASELLQIWIRIVLFLSGKSLLLPQLKTGKIRE